MKTTFAAASSFVLVLLPGQVCALRQDHYDLTSLILDSHAVILAERGAQRPLKNWAAATTFTVKRVYRGNMLPGQKIEVFGHTSEYHANGSQLDYWGEKITLDPETILIVGQWDPSRSGMQSWLPNDTPSLRIISERFLSEGLVYKREEGYVQPQGPASADGHFMGPSKALHLVEFETELRKSIATVEGFLRATKLTEPAARRDAILALIKNQEHPLETGYAPLSRDGYADRIRQRALELFSKWGAIDAALEVAARSGEGLGFHFRCPISAQQLLAAAQREDVPSCRRTAALYLLARDYLTEHHGLDDVKALLQCKDLAVKRAAAHILGQITRIHASNPGHYSREDSRPIVEALLSAWREEPDTAFRLTILRASKGSFFTQMLTAEDRRPEVLLLWELRGERVAYLAASLNGESVLRRNLVLVAAPLHANKEYRVRCEARGTTDFLFSSSSGGEAFQVRFEPPLAPGHYRVWLELEPGDVKGAKRAKQVIRTDSKEIDIGSVERLRWSQHRM